MRRVLRTTALVLAGALLAAQAVHPALNQSTGPEPQALAALHPPPPAVAGLLAEACYDCHSNHTRYPWYAHLQPSAWWLASHIRAGREALNFSTFGAYPPKRQGRLLTAVADEVGDGEMPLRSYTWMHPAARLTPAQRKQLADWADGLQEEIGDAKS